MNFTHVLITRPEPQCTELAQWVRARGFEAVVMPAFEFEALPLAPDLPANWRGIYPDVIVFTSPRAVQFGLEQLDPDWVSGAVIAALGPATSGVLETAGVEVNIVAAAPSGSETLLDNPLFDDKSGFALLLAAPGGREALQEGLLARGWAVSMAEVYRRVPLAPSTEAFEALRAAGGVLSTWTSATAMSWILDALPVDVRNKVLDGVHITASARIAARADALRAAKVIDAGGAGNRALIEAIGDLADDQ